MQMIRHDNVFVQRNHWKAFRQRSPIAIHDFADWRQFKLECRVGFEVGRHIEKMGSRKGYPYIYIRFLRVCQNLIAVASTNRYEIRAAF